MMAAAMEGIVETESSSRLPGPNRENADYYYMKALDYLASTTENHDTHGDDSCACLQCPSSAAEDDDEDEHFAAMNFRPGLTLDELQGTSSSSSGECFRRKSTSDLLSNRSAALQAQSELRTRKCSIGGRAYQAGSSDPSKSQPKRKLSDGHVHWADEFQKDLTRCNPRKAYTRHPSHQSPQFKPILKSSPEDCAQS